MNIDEFQLPFPDEVLEAARRFQQGDVLEKPPLAYHTVGLYPVWALSKNAPCDENVTLVEIDGTSFDYGVITSQTCDIVEEDTARPRKPWVQVSPVYTLADPSPMLSRSIEAMANADFVRLTGEPFANLFYVADLRISLPLEKSVLVGREPISGFSSKAARDAFADHCAAYHNRPVLSAVVHAKVVKHMRRYFERLDALRQDCRSAAITGLRLKVTETEIPVAQVVVLFANDDEESRKKAVAAFDRWWDAATANAKDDKITLLANRYTSLDEISASEYLSSVPLRLDLIVNP